MLVRLFVILMFLGIFSEADAQNNLYKAWIKVQPENDLRNIEALFVNQTDKEQSFRYQLKLDKSGTNTSSNTQSGTFIAAPGKELSLSSAQINITSQDYFKALLLVYHQGDLVAKDSIEIGIKAVPTPTPTPKKQPSSGFSDNLEIDGLIIDETRSKTARDFYDFFYSKWIAPVNAKDYSIRIRELPSRGRVARITVEVNDRPLYTRVLQPRLELIEDMSKQAIRIVRQHLDKNETMKKQLGSEDQQGSGIF